MDVEININYKIVSGELSIMTDTKASSHDEAMAFIGDFINLLRHWDGKQEIVVPITEKPKAARSRKPRALFNDQQKADIIARYKAGEGPKAISESLGCARSTIIHLIKKAGATEGRTGKHLAALNKSRTKQHEPAPEEPV